MTAAGPEGYDAGVALPGSLFLFGIYGKRATRETIALLRSTGASGVLLLARNIESPEQTRALTEELRQRLGRPLLIAVDHEGGWVLRFKNGVTAFPGNAALGRAGDPRLAYETGRHMARELSRLGINLNLAPVLDVVTDRYNPGIGIRSFGKDPRLVSRLGAALIRGLQENGVGACAKHFPGKGAATVDAHVELPTIRLPKPEFERTHLAPFAAAVKAGVDCVMTSHVRYPALDKAAATFSGRITRGLLRERLGFNGVVIADDLCMGAVSQHLPTQTAAVSALQAGHDLLIVAHDANAQREAAELLTAAAAQGHVRAEEIERSQSRVRALILRRGVLSRGRPPGLGAAALGEAVARKALETVQQGRIVLPLRPGKAPLLALLPDFAQIQDRFTFEGGPRGPERLVRESLAAWGPARLSRAPVSCARTGSIREEVRRAQRVLFFCFEAMRFPGQRAVLDILKEEASAKTAVCLIRSPWDRAWLDPDMTALDAYGYRLSQLRAALARLLGRVPS